MSGQNSGYTIPFGIDAGDFFNGLKEIDSGVDKMATNTKEATAAMVGGFQKTAEAGDKLNKTIVTTAASTTTLSTQANKLGKDLGTALSGNNVGTDLQKKVDSFTTSLTKFSQQANKKIAFNIDTAKLKQFEQMLIDGQDELKVLAQVSAYAKDQLKGLAPDSAEFQALNQQIKVADEFLKGLGSTSDQVTEKQKSLKAQLKEMKAALADMELAGQGGTAAFEKMSIEAGKVEDQIGDVSHRVRVLASDTKYLDAGVQAVTALAGGFAIAQGASALFGSENKDLQKTIEKVTGAMALLQGIQAIANALNKDSALSVLFFSKAKKAQVVATEAAAAATGTEAVATLGAAAATKTWTAALLTNPIFILVAVIAAVTAALIAFSGGSNDAEDATKKLNDELERQSELLKLDTNDINRREQLNIAIAKSQGKTESQITEIQGKALAERINNRRGHLGELKKLYNDETNAKNRSVEDEKKLGDELTNLEEADDDDINQLKILRINRTKQQNDEAVALRKKQIEEAKKAAEEKKRIIEQQLKFLKELGDAQIEAITNQYEKERAKVRENLRVKVAELEAEKSLSKQASATRIKLIAQLRKNEQTELDAIDKKEGKDFATLQLTRQQIEADLLKEGLAKDLELNHLAFTEKRRQVIDQFKDDKETRLRLIKELNDAEQAQKDKLTKAAALTDLEKQREIEILQVQTAASFLGDLPKVEEQKQIDVLKVKLKYASKALDLLLAQGNAENSLQVLQAKKLVQDLEKELKGVLKNRNDKDGFSFFDLLGLGDLSEEQRKAVTDAATKSLDAVRQITDFIVGQYQRQIDKKQEVIDQTEQQINDLEGQLEKEKQLREDGFANNVDLIEQEIAEKKKQKEEEIKQQQELQRKQQAIQKAQLILDTVTQASNLITSATQIFKALSGIPFIGVPLAIATIALMTGAFVAAKAKAFQAIGDQKSFGEGGEVDGPSHAAGGVKYVATDGSGVRELEGNEFVTKKRQAQKYKPLLHAINDDRLKQMNDEDLGDLLSSLGIHFENDKAEEAINFTKQKEIEKNILFLSSPGNDIDALENIGANVAYLANAKKNEVERWDDDQFYYERFGGHTKKYPKKK